MRVLFCGSSQAQHIAELFKLKGHKCCVIPSGKVNLLNKMKFVVGIMKADLVYCVSGSLAPSKRNRLIRSLRSSKKATIQHWIGTDTLEAQAYIDAGGHFDAALRYVNLAGSDLLHEELEAIGIESVVVPIVPTGISFQPLAMPKRHAVIVYAPEGREAFYGLDKIEELARRHSDIEFHIVANTGIHAAEDVSNIIYEGHLNRNDMNELYLRCSIVVRYPDHDGLSMMLLEALGLGRQMLYRYKFPFAETPLNDSIEEIDKTFSAMIANPPELNERASEYINEMYSMEKQIERYESLGIL